MSINLKLELEIACNLLENHHPNCNWAFDADGKSIGLAEPDLNAEVTETCAEFDEMYGKGYPRGRTCWEHDKIREWQKYLGLI